jgi:hypothetical protein
LDLSLPYVAGFFDGEGSIGVYLNGQRQGRTLRVQLTQTATPQATELLAAIRARWGGSLCLMNRAKPRQAWNWQASAGKGYLFLRDVRPWLILKAEQADLVLKWWAARPGPRRSVVDGRHLPLSDADRAAAIAVDRALRAMKRQTLTAMDDQQ